MAIEAQYLSILKQVIDIASMEVPRRLRALCLSYPDLLVTSKYLAYEVSEDFVNKLPVRPDSKEIWSWHGLKECEEPIFETEAFFNELNVDIEIIDIVAARGKERIVDLNEPLPDDLRAKFDIVIDTGTCEHCFNVGQAFKNSCEAVALGGFLVHAAPLTKSNHGFWNFCPTIYPDFFGDNGFKLLHMSGFDGKISEGLRRFDISPFERSLVPPESAIFVAAKRSSVQELIWPVQRKYRKQNF